MRTVFKYYKSYIPLIVGILAFLFGQAMCELALPGIHVGYHQQRDRQGRYGLYLEDRHDHDPGILRECGMLYRQQLFIGEDGGRFGSQDPRRAVRQSHGFFSCGTVGVFHSIPDHPVYQRCANGAADDCHDAETRLLRADHGDRRRSSRHCGPAFPFPGR